jgi:hypothetical protein
MVQKSHFFHTRDTSLICESTDIAAGSDTGIIMTVGGGDPCQICAPTSRATAFTIICSDEATPNIVSAELAAVPSPVYQIKIKHCSGCRTEDPRFCSIDQSSVQLLIDVQVVGAPAKLSLLPPPSPIQVSTQTGSDLLLEGTIQHALNNTVTVVINSGSSTAAEGTLSFGPQSSVILSLTDMSTGKQYPCSQGKARRGKFVTLACTFGNGDVLVLSGSIL